MPRTNSVAASADRKPISRRLFMQLRIFGLIFLVMLGVLVYDVVTGQVGPLIGAGGSPSAS